MKLINRISRMFGLSAMLVALAAPAWADRHDRDRDQDHDHDRRWHGDIRHFEDHDVHVWRGGYWHHGRHDGRYGWWWVVGGIWYLYADPVYPYPDPYRPPVVIVQPPPSAPPPTTQMWYYCPSAKGYYPYVSVCPGGWRTVPATPPGQ